MIKNSCLRLLCYVYRMYQDFPGRWRFEAVIKSRFTDIGELSAGPIRIARGYSLWANPKDWDGIHYLTGGINPREPITNIVSQILGPGDCMLDIGANVGYFSMLGSMLVGKSGQIHSFEASPETSQHLRLVATNPYGNVILHEVAVSNQCGEVEFSCGPTTHSGLSSMRDLGDRTSARVKIPCITIDSILDHIPTTKLIKIDVEGAELLVLQGMRQLLQRDRPCIILELTDSFLRELGSSADELLVYMKSAEYEPYVIRNPIEPLPGVIDEQADILFVPKGLPAPQYNQDLRPSRP